MEQEAKNLLRKWIKAYPESNHPYDRERFYDLVFYCLKNDEFINEDNILQELRNHKNWGNESIKDFAKEQTILFSRIKDFFDYLNVKHNIKI